MRKHVAPSTPTASIPDPERGGFLPPEGRVVSWTPHWAGMALREEILVTDAVEEAEAAPAAPEPDHSPVGHEPAEIAEAHSQA
jgi:hypothetical protein